ncbi:Facilitated trehalose transporter Tret1 [Armadillidium vulgare]|nr:Facilitated trehalose transporter Tret1 [Armadillidium vulgare]
MKKKKKTSMKEELQKYGVRESYIRQILFSFILGGFLLFVGYLVGTTTMLPRIVNEGSNITYSSEDLKFLASIPLLIKIPATPASVYFTEKFGPSFILRWCFVGGFLCYIAMAFFRMLTALWIGRIVLYITCALQSVMVSFGILFVYVVFSYLDGMTATLCNAGLVLFGVIGSFYLPESPYWLVKKGRLKDAAKSISRIIGPKRRLKQKRLLTETVTLYEKEKSERSRRHKKDSALQQIKLFKKRRNLKALSFLLLIFLLRELGGISTIFHYILLVFQESNLSIDIFTCTIIGGVTRLISNILTSVLQDRVGRRKILIPTTFISAVCLIFTGLVFHFNVEGLKIMCVVAIMIFILTVSMGMGSMPFMLLGEIMPMEVKFVGNSIIIVYFNITLFLVLCTMPSIIRIFGINFLFLLFGSVNFATSVIFYFLLPETNHKTLTQLQNLFKSCMSEFYEELEGECFRFFDTEEMNYGASEVLCESGENWELEPNGGSDENCAQLSTSDQFYFHDEDCLEGFGSPICQKGLLQETDEYSQSLFELSESEEEGFKIEVETCPENFTYIGESCFFFGIDMKKQTFEDASAFCRNALRANESYWIGASDRGDEGEWLWSDFTQVEMGPPFWGSTNGTAEPSGGEDQNCAMLYKNDRYYFHDEKKF